MGNIAIGSFSSLANTTGDNNVLIGTESNTSSGNLNFAVAIGANAIVGASNSMTLGGVGIYQVKVGIGTSTPDTDFDIKQDDFGGDERGIRLERSDNTDNWRMFIGQGSDLGLAFNNGTVGSFDDVTGNYVPSSD